MLSRIILSAVFAISLFATPQTASAEPSEIFQDGFVLENLAAVSTDVLSDISGGTAVIVSSADIASQVDGNHIGSIGMTGEIANNSINNNSGFTTLIANSGNQVSISQATSISIYVH